MSDAHAHPCEGFIDEEKRLSVLRAFSVLDTPPELEFDRLVKLAAQLCRTPIAALSLVDEKRQWFKAVEGLSVRQTDISLSFCNLKSKIENSEAPLSPTV